MSTPQTLSTPLKHTLLPEWIHAITILLGHPLTSEVGQHIQKRIIYQANLCYTKFALRWDLIQFEDSKHLQKYEETNGSISYLKSNTVKQLVSLKIYMILLISQDKHAGLNYNPTHFIKGEQLFKLTAIDFKTALINEMFENPRSKTTFRALMYKITPPSSSVRSPIHMVPTPFKKGTKPDDPPQNVDKSHVSAPISTITNLYITCTLDTSCDQLLHLDPPWHSSDPQDISSVENIKLNFFLNLKYNWTMPTFHQQMFSLGTMIMICSYPTKRLIPHLTISTLRTLMSVKMKISSLSMPPTFSHTIALPQFMAQHNYEGLKPTGTPSAVSTAIQASSDHPFNPWCGRNPMATQCNQSQ